jgi:hypothetical protein
MRDNRTSGAAHRCVWVAAVILLHAVASDHVRAAESKWVTTGATGRLMYTPDAEGDRILDFSNVGYKGRGLEALPQNIPTVLTISPIAGDDTAHIQAAINQVAAMPLGPDGYRGAIQLQAGTYDINTQLNITASGIVLRGEGRGTDGTILHGRGTTQRALINIYGSGGATSVGTARNMIDKVVPAGSRSFRVDVPGEFSVGDKVRITHPSTQAWINAIGMNNPPDGDPPWQAGSLDLLFDRTVTRIEGNRVFIDAPLPQSFDKQLVNGTIRRYNWAGAIRNVGIENMRGDTDFVSPTDENHAWTFVSVGQTGTQGRAEDVWVRHITSIHFGYASVLANPGSKWVTVDDAINLDPISIITGSRRYAFDLSGEYGLVANSSSDKGRHDFVNNSSRTKGPNVFYNSTATNSNSDTGPHQRWSTGSLFDNITVQGHDINIRNRGSFGTSHGWAGANMVVWNSQARAFRVQNPPTSQNWLVGSIGPIVNDLTFGPQPPGYYDSHGTKVTTGGVLSLYEAQMNDARDITAFQWDGGQGNWNDASQWAQQVAPTSVYAVSLRDYLVGDIDQYVHDGAGSVDNAFVDPAWSTYVQGTNGLPVTKFDDLAGSKNVAFTIQNQLSTGEQVIHGFLALGMRQAGGSVNDDYIRLFDADPANRLELSALGWASQINASNTFVGVLDLGTHLDKLQTGSVNVQISDNTGVDWAIYTVAVATPIATSVKPSVTMSSGGEITIDSAVNPIKELSITGATRATLALASSGRLEIEQTFVMNGTAELSIDLAGTGVGQFGQLVVGDHAALDGTLRVNLQGNYSPSAGDYFQIISAGSLSGGFDAVHLPQLNGGLVWAIGDEANSIWLAVLFAGDYDHNGQVDDADYLLWKQQYGLIGNFAADGNGDGVVDAADFTVWRNNLGAGLGFGEGQGGVSSLPQVSVPEPTSLLLLIWAMGLGSTFLR